MQTESTKKEGKIEGRKRGREGEGKEEGKEEAREEGGSDAVLQALRSNHLPISSLTCEFCFFSLHIVLRKTLVIPERDPQISNPPQPCSTLAEQNTCQALKCLKLIPQLQLQL